jgi:hypothetical protein
VLSITASIGSGAVVSIDESYRNLCHEVEAARILREEFT